MPESRSPQPVTAGAVGQFFLEIAGLIGVARLGWHLAGGGASVSGEGPSQFPSSDEEIPLLAELTLAVFAAAGVFVTMAMVD